MILGLDTSTSDLGLALVDEKGTRLYLRYALKQMENLPVFLKQCFKLVQVEPEQVSVIGVIRGPGNYTSLRAGLVLAKTWAQLYQIPVMGFDKIEVLLYGLRHLQRPLMPWINVRQGQVYAAIGQFHEAGIEYLIKPQVETVQGWLAKRDDLPVRPEIVGDISERLQIESIWGIENLAEMVAFWAYERLSQGHQTELMQLQPFYIRPAV